MWKILIRINKNLVYAIPVMMLAGCLTGLGLDVQFVRELKVLVMPHTILMVFPMMAPPNIKHLQKGQDV